MRRNTNVPKDFHKWLMVLDVLETEDVMRYVQL